MADSATKATALWVVRRLRRAGFQALFAGGCVRDMLLGHRCSDYDVATDATPPQVKKLFGRVLMVGAKFGVAMVLRDGRKVEVATFRRDESYSDGRRPDAVRFADARQDALRRDFTINGMFYDPLGRQVIDYVGGQQDLRRQLLQTIGSPQERFAEDYLRMLRAVRFAVRLGFRLGRQTARAIGTFAPRITEISGERVFEELAKMLERPSAAEALRLLRQVGLARHVLPELFARAGLWQRAVRRVADVAPYRDRVLALAALAGELAPPEIAQLLRRGGQSNDLRDALCWLTAHRDDWRQVSEIPLADFKRLLAHEQFPRLERLWTHQERRATGRQLARRALGRRKRAISPEKIAPSPLVTGRDLMALGLEEGPLLGALLRQLYDAQLNEQLLTRQQALAAAAERIRHRGPQAS